MQNAWKIPDFRKKILFTLLMIIVFRIGANIPAPFLNMEALAAPDGFCDRQLQRQRAWRI